MKTLLVNPPCDYDFERSGRWPSKSTAGACQEPLFLAYAAAVLEQAGLKEELIDCRPLRINVDDLLKKISEDTGLVVLQTSTPSIDYDISVAKFLKTKRPNIKIVLVGPHPTVFNREILKEHECIDIIARGEYDYTIRDIVVWLQKGKDLAQVEGITFRNGQEIVKTPDRPFIEELDQLPFPSRHTLPIDKYYEPLFIGRPTLRLTTSRGCPFGCTFCAWPQIMYGKKYRIRSIGNILDEIIMLKEEYKIKEFYFDDDTFTVDSQRVINLCEEIIRRKVNLPWDCLGRVDRVNEDMLSKMSEAGCIVIRYGVETASEEILKRAKKGITVAQIEEAFDKTHKAGIRTHATVMFGLPGETEETIDKTIRFILELNPDYVQFAIATPYPGTEFYNTAKENKWLVAQDWSDFNPVGNSVICYPELNKETIVNAVKKAYRKFYTRPRYIIHRISSIKRLSEISQMLKASINLVRNIW